ncbi:AcrR family transcriptional regulator [Allocatelliglobosispora scoriae]|uniref:AcrR family transcriptional regulator n=1 Tax=Allocatelliglobosispora scoriae TaxID=643052 RepID=A0A841C0G7_9ACTN|nr:TetR/AcrR family transcriptional regulator [Allocatelliglobosispora scoriae]MBB5873425.1 AcrR family transcriptional regulator [Allocatelliglobosispora scoriae]
MEATATLRERKKEATRQALYEAVLRLALERGLDDVTVEAVADEANVSRRTFSNYFANKEDALLHGDRTRIDKLLDGLRERPRDEPPWRALTMAAAAQFDPLTSIDASWLAQLQLLRRHPSLLARQVTAQGILEQQLAAMIAERDPGHPDEPMRSRVLAATFLATLRTATTVWAEQKGPMPLGAAVRAALDRAAEAFA